MSIDDILRKYMSCYESERHNKMFAERIIITDEVVSQAKSAILAEILECLPKRKLPPEFDYDYGFNACIAEVRQAIKSRFEDGK